MAVLYDLLWFTNVNEQNIKKERGIVKEVEADQAREEPAEIMHINHDSESIFPRIWKLAQVILIPKVNEFRVPHLDNLRCISLLPALGKCLEKLFVNRISWYLRRGDFLSSDQYGLSPHKSTEDALLRLNEIVKRKKKETFTLNLDIS
ncbi:uncharacterized protein TNCV_2357711 [Trichonephila clavipes]|nr:uncharacterized protein TNCV_2357711 [Trichonephila clavipes]